MVQVFRNTLVDTPEGSTHHTGTCQRNHIDNQVTIVKWWRLPSSSLPFFPAWVFKWIYTPVFKECWLLRCLRSCIIIVRWLRWILPGASLCTWCTFFFFLSCLFFFFLDEDKPLVFQGIFYIFKLPNAGIHSLASKGAVGYLCGEGQHTHLWTGALARQVGKSELLTVSFYCFPHFILETRSHFEP